MRLCYAKLHIPKAGNANKEYTLLCMGCICIFMFIFNHLSCFTQNKTP